MKKAPSPFRCSLLLAVMFGSASCYDRPGSGGDAAVTGDAESDLASDSDEEDGADFEEAGDGEEWTVVGEENQPVPTRPSRSAPRRQQATQEVTGPRLSTKFRVSGGASPSALPYEVGRWERDPRKAMAEARETRRLVLLWMENSKVSNKLLPAEVFRHPAFLALEKDELVLTRVDYGEQRVEVSDYGKMLKKSLDTKGFPSLYLLSPDGDELERFRGYRPDSFPIIIGKLEEHVKSHHLKETHRSERLAEEGFRHWQNYQGRSLFAKVAAVAKDDKTVTLEDAYGKHSSYSIINLSDADRKYLAERLAEAGNEVNPN